MFENKFTTVVHAIKNTVPVLEQVPSVWLAVNKTWAIKISKPCSFDSYKDIIARVTLFYNDVSKWDTLITNDTNLEKLCNKLARKIKENKHT